MTALDADTTPRAAAPAADVPRIRALLRQQRFAEALNAAVDLLAREPDDRDGLLCAAIARRGLGRIADAQATLDALERLRPRFSRLHQERGNCFIELKQAPQAIEAHLLAVNLNHALLASWSMLEGLYRMTGQTDNAAVAASHVATLKALPPAVVTATGLFMDGDLDAAESMVRAYLLKHGNQVEAMRLLARIGIARKVYDDAELLLAAVLQLAPGYRTARREYAEVLIELHRYPEARRELERLLREEPDNRLVKTLHGTACVGLGEHEQAVELYRELLQGTPEDADLHLWIAHALKTLGRTREAIESYRLAATLRPDFGDAYWSLANLKTYRFTDEELARLRAAQADPAVAPADRPHLCFALAKALEDRGAYADAFLHYERGNALKRAESTYRPELIEINTRQQIAVCTAEFFEHRRGFGRPDPDPIFIVGLPRSGSTLLEQILASHSKVEGTQELPNIQQIVGRLRGRDPDPDDPRYPRVLGEMTLDESRQLGATYLADTRVYRAGKAPAPDAPPQAVPYFIDKMPNNFRHLGLIRLMLPNAKIIDARREPMACCFSNFTQLFAQGQEFTYRMEDIARYYRTYLELMEHWDRAIPGWILRILHEDVVDDLERSVRRMLDFCGLEFEPQCLAFHETARSVRTASSEQVRRPIYREGLDHWTHFAPWLEPLRASLGDALTRYRDG